MQDRFGLLARWAFLIGFWAVATGAMLGAWNGGAHLFADCVRTIPRGAGRGGIRLPLRKEHLLPRISGLDVVPAYDPARLRRAGPAGDRLGLARCSFPALPGDYSAHPPELPACGPRVPQPARLQPSPRRLCDSLHRGRCVGGARWPVTGGPWVTESAQFLNSQHHWFELLIGVSVQFMLLYSKVKVLRR
jgi:hypothetical protein